MAVPPFGSAPTASATTTKQGKVKLAKNLGGTADLPTVVGLTIASEAEGDILYRNATDWVRLPKGTAAQQLRVNAGATAPEWATIASGGQTTYDAIVAPSGGDYTTLGAAIAAASAGWSIFIKEGTYSESAISSALNNLTIVGENPNTAILALTTTTTVFSGTGVNFRNIGITASTGALQFTGARAYLTNIRMIASDQPAATRSLDFNSADGIIDSIFYQNTKASGSPTQNCFTCSGDKAKVINSTFIVHCLATSAGSISLSGQYVVFANNTVYAGTLDSGWILSVAQNNMTITGNVFKGFSTTPSAIIRVAGSENTITGNNTEGGLSGILLAVGSRNVVTGNAITDTTTYGIEISTAGAKTHLMISGNMIHKVSTGVGIKVTTGNSYINITGNDFANGTVAAEIDSGAVGVAFTNNMCYSLTASTGMLSDDGTDSYIANNHGFNIQHEKIFVSMKNTSGGTINAGDVVIYKGVANGNEVTTTATASDSNVFGMATAAITNNSFGIIQVKGKTVLLKVDGTTDIAIGDPLTTFTTAGISKKAAAASLGVTLGDLAFAVALEAYTTNDSNGVIDALLIDPKRL